VQIDNGMPFDPALDLSATLSADGHRVALFVVNQTTRPQERTINVAALMPLSRDVSVWTLADTAKGLQRDAANSWHEPDRIRSEPGKTALNNGKIVYEFPPLSLTVLEARREGDSGE
jgi:alpha-L-arabinofuranosidase